MSRPLVTKASNVTDDVLRKHIREVTNAKEELEAANGAYRATLKAAKKDGVNQKQLIAALHAKKREEDDVKGDLRDYVRYLALCNVHLQQGELFGNVLAPDADLAEPGETTEHEVWEAKQNGLSAGKAGRHRRENPYPPGYELFVAWDEGYLEGQGGIAPEMGPKARKASTSKQRRGPGRLPLQ